MMTTSEQIERRPDLMRQLIEIRRTCDRIARQVREMAASCTREVDDGSERVRDA